MGVHPASPHRHLRHQLHRRRHPRADRVRRKPQHPDGGCSTVAALDLTDSRELWHTALVLANGDTYNRIGALAVGGGLSVVLDTGTGKDAPAVRAVDLHTGSARWTAEVPKGCAAFRAATVSKRVLAVLACGGEMKLAAFDLADGSEQWTTSLGTRHGVTTDASVTITAAESRSCCGWTRASGASTPSSPSGRMAVSGRGSRSPATVSVRSAPTWPSPTDGSSRSPTAASGGSSRRST
ncbi:PQQ-binding-like beta-propeller repeat protein [Streptomyces sp. NPDC047130]|uniref:outer membrane protein assembly factor BamB family protein n=1 Tax=Streptomyces sp. NPDC047130 TaxID=3155261 RepID=UPI0033E484ED